MTQRERQNKELRREIQRLRAWRDAARELEQENARLRALNNVRLPPEAGFVTGEILSDSGGPFLHTGLANVGRRDGVQDGAAVMDGAGLAGRVVGLGRRAARVLYVTDYSSRVPVIIRPSGQTGLFIMHLLHSTRRKGNQIKPKAGIDPLQLIPEQAVQMTRITGWGRGRDIHMADIAIGFIDGQMQPATAQARLFELRTEVLAEVR